MSALADRGASTRTAALASVAVAILLIGCKGYAAWATGSVSVLASLADSSLDLVASLVILWAVRVAAVPPDSDHRFGHGKAEALAALFQVVMIVVSAIGIIVEAVRSFQHGGRVEHAATGIVVSVIAIVATFALVTLQQRVIASTASVAIESDRVHYLSDLLLNATVIVALAIDALFDVRGIDALFACLIALYLLRAGWTSANRAVDQLMDKEWPDERRLHFLQVAAQHPELKGIHDLRTRSSGTRDFVQFHVWVAPDITLADAHRVMEEVEGKLAREFPGVEILIHPDPEGHIDVSRAVDVMANAAPSLRSF